MQKYGKKLCAGSGVLFGVITVGPVIYQRHWIARGLDWYGDDLYEFPKLRGPHNRAKVIARLNQNLAAWRTASGQRRPAVSICETNSPYDSHRSEFFATIAHWLAGHNGNRMLTSSHGSLTASSASWSPPPISTPRPYKEIREDGHPVVILAGREIVAILKSQGCATAYAVGQLLKASYAAVPIQQPAPGAARVPVTGSAAARRVSGPAAQCQIRPLPCGHDR